MRFREWNVLYFDLNFTELCSYGFNWHLNRIGLDDSLVPNRRQAIIWTNAAWFTDAYMRHCVCVCVVMVVVVVESGVGSGGSVRTNWKDRRNSSGYLISDMCGICKFWYKTPLPQVCRSVFVQSRNIYSPSLIYKSVPTTTHGSLDTLSTGLGTVYGNRIQSMDFRSQRSQSVQQYCQCDVLIDIWA